MSTDGFLAVQFRHFSEKMSAVTLELATLKPSYITSVLDFLSVFPEYSGQK